MGSPVRSLLLALTLASAAPAGAGEPVAGACEVVPAGGPVSILIVESAQKVRDFAAAAVEAGAATVRGDATTVIFADGRAVTSDVGALTRHLNELGWANRRIEVVASFPKARARRSYG